MPPYPVAAITAWMKPKMMVRSFSVMNRVLVVGLQSSVVGKKH
jgi:hypothetical protein